MCCVIAVRQYGAVFKRAPAHVCCACRWWSGLKYSVNSRFVLPIAPPAPYAITTPNAVFHTWHRSTYSATPPSLLSFPCHSLHPQYLTGWFVSPRCRCYDCVFLRICLQVVATEMRQCEYRAVIPSALACGSKIFSTSFFGRLFNLLLWTAKAVVYLALFLLVSAAAALVVSAFTGYGSRFVPSLPQVPIFGFISNLLCISHSFLPLAVAQRVPQAIPKQVRGQPQARRWNLNGES